MIKFKYDAEKLVNGIREIILEKGYFYPMGEFIIHIPEEDKEFPLDLSEYTAEMFLNKQAIFTALQSSAAMDEAKYLAEVAALERDLDIAKGHAFNASNAGKLEDRRRERDTDEEVIKIQEKLTVAETYLRYMTALKTSYEAYCKLFSRGITVRESEIKLQ